MTSAIDQTKARYDDLPYSSYAYLYSAPEQLAAVATLFGLPGPEVATSRVLELGCASGGNLIPFALRHPAATAVGLDISGVQVTIGRDYIARLGADNVVLQEADFLQVEPAELGKFDYIIAHGVYSWVSPEAQDAVLRIISECLSSNGVAFVSYNTYPGWKAKEILRDAMLLHAGADRSPTEQVAYGRSMLAFLENTSLKSGATRAALNENLAQILRSPASYMAHDYLEPFNLPCYFNEFLERTGKHGLAYLGEAQPSMMMPSNYGPEMAQQLYGALGEDQVRVEQYLDFAISRSFRQTLLVRAERAATLRWQLDEKAVGELNFAAYLYCKDGPIRFDGQPQEFAAPSHTASLTVGLSGLKRAIELLEQRWPATVTRDELVRHAQLTQGDVGAVAPEILADAVGELLEMLVLRGMARIRLAPVEAAVEDDDVTIDPVVQRQVNAIDASQTHVANVWHYSVDIGDAERLLLPTIDGPIDRKKLATIVEAALREGRLPIPDAGDQSNADPAKQAEAFVDGFLQRMREAAVLRRLP
jgi:SAM-dependent methyltransferase